MFFSILGIVAAALTTGSFLPQAVLTIKTKDTSGISLVMYVMFTAGVLSWLVYGLYLGNTALILANAVTFVLASIILIYKVGNTIKDGRASSSH
jgi:MtN3 and saliva related transmembrane protein